MSEQLSVRATLDTAAGPAGYYALARLPEHGLADPARLPYSIKVLLEAALRHAEQGTGAIDDVAALAAWPETAGRREIAFRPARVLHQDFNGGAAMVDFTAMRSAAARLGGDPDLINPLVPTDFVIDHSVQVDFWGAPDAAERNVEREFERNGERYRFLRWAQQAYRNFRVIPPGIGIVHQVNLEFLASVVQLREGPGGLEIYPDSVAGTDSHTTMINGLGVLGWGVGGIEAEAAMLAQPLIMPVPRVVGVHLRGRLLAGVTATDLVLTVTQALRRHGVVGAFVEFCGEGLDVLSLADRATIANMAPEYGATCGYVPVDRETLAYLLATGRNPRHVDLVERYTRAQGLFRTLGASEPCFNEVIEIDLGTVEASLAGPRRPHDRLSLADVKGSVQDALSERGRGAPTGRQGIRDGAVVLASITSCTNTSNPSVMIGAGLLAKRAVERGLRVPDYIKTSLAPGSPIVADYLRRAGLLPYLEQLGFYLVGFGCTTCAGGSGPLLPGIAEAVEGRDLSVAAVLSGNRNFEGRIHPQCRLAYLASPALVVAFALAGRVDIDLKSEPLGLDSRGAPVYLHEIWPAEADIQDMITAALRVEDFQTRYATAFAGEPLWQALPHSAGALYTWDPDSTYIQEPPYFSDLGRELLLREIRSARALVVLGDSITTDHISPAGVIPLRSAAASYLREHGVAPEDFNSYGARRGNHEVMLRGTFANIHLRNRLAGGREGGWTTHLPSGELLPIYEAAMRYAAENTPLLVLAGKDYGAGSSRDWAAKGTALLGVRAVLAESFERIHRGNLAGMGVLPLQHLPGESAASLGLSGAEIFDIEGLDALAPGTQAQITARRADGTTVRFSAGVRLDSGIESEYVRAGGILPYVLRRLLAREPRR